MQRNLNWPQQILTLGNLTPNKYTATWLVSNVPLTHDGRSGASHPLVSRGDNSNGSRSHRFVTWGAGGGRCRNGTREHRHVARSGEDVGSVFVRAKSLRTSHRVPSFFLWSGFRFSFQTFRTRDDLQQLAGARAGPALFKLYNVISIKMRKYNKNNKPNVYGSWSGSKASCFRDNVRLKTIFKNWVVDRVRMQEWRWRFFPAC